MEQEKLPWWDEYRLYGIPRTFAPYPEKPVFEMLEIAARRYPKNGYIQYEYLMTYPKMLRKAERLAGAFWELGLQRGDRIATILPTSIQFVMADFAISRAGMVHIPSSSLEPESVLEHKLKEGAPRALICLASFADRALQLKKKVGIDHLIFTKLEDYATRYIHLEGGEDTAFFREGCWMSDLIKGVQMRAPEMAHDVEKEVETLLFTGGTTGLPKGCMLTHRNIYANAIQNLNAFGQAGKLMSGAISVLLGLPFFHSYGHVIMHTMTLMGVNQILIPEPRDTASMAAMIARHKPVIQIGVPTQFLNIAKDSAGGSGILGISGSAPLPPSIQKEFETKSGGGIMEGYGLSEMSPTSHLNTTLLLRLFGGRRVAGGIAQFLRIPGITRGTNRFLQFLGHRRTGAMFNSLTRRLVSSSINSRRSRSEKRGTIGIPFPDTEIKILDVESGRALSWQELSNGKTGELCLRGPQRMLGYWPEAGSGLDEEGYVRTSDIVRVDERGYFYIVDRTKDMINVSGYKVYSRELDDLLHTHPAVEQAAAVGVPDPDREGSERVIVFLKVREEQKGQVDDKGILSFMEEKVAKYALPRRVHFIDEMPLTAIQKVDKKELRRMALGLEGASSSAR